MPTGFLWHMRISTIDSKIILANRCCMFSLQAESCTRGHLTRDGEQHIEISIPATSIALQTHSGTFPAGNCANAHNEYQ